MRQMVGKAVHAQVVPADECILPARNEPGTYKQELLKALCYY